MDWYKEHEELDFHLSHQWNDLTGSLSLIQLQAINELTIDEYVRYYLYEEFRRENQRAQGEGVSKESGIARESD